MRKRLGLRSHDRVDIVSRRGRVRGVELRLTEITAPGQVFMPFHYFETNVNEVTQSAFDPDLARAELQAVRGSGGTVRSSKHEKQLVVVGNGMAGVACVEQILKHQHEFEITIFGDETHVNYNRILLSSVLAGEKSADDIVLNDIDWYQTNDIQPAARRRSHRHRSPSRRIVIGDDGSVDRVRQADPRHRQQRLHPADPGRRQEERLRVPHAGRHARAAANGRARAARRW